MIRKKKLLIISCILIMFGVNLCNAYSYCVEVNADENISINIQRDSANTEQNGQGTLVTAFYDAAGKLDDIITEKNIEISQDGIQRIYSKPDKFCTVKSFVINTLQMVKPVSNVGMTDNYITYRSTMHNTFAKLEAAQPVTLLFVGGSVTAGQEASDWTKKSWRGLVTAWLRAQYPQSNINSISAAVGGTGSRMALYRIDTLLEAYNPDVVFMMTSFNDSYLENNTENSAGNMENIICHIRRSCPQANMLIAYDIGRSLAQICLSDNLKFYNYAQAQENVAAHYGVDSLNAGREVTDSINTYSDTQWNQYFDGSVHPLDSGHEKYAQCFLRYLTAQQQSFIRGEATAPQASVDPMGKIYSKINYLAPKDVNVSSVSGWSIINCPKPIGKECTRCFYSETNSDEMTFTVEGTDIELMWRGDSGVTVECSIDGGAFKELGVPNGYLSKLVIGASELSHTVTIKNTSATGKKIYLQAVCSKQ